MERHQGQLEQGSGNDESETHIGDQLTGKTGKKRLGKLDTLPSRKGHHLDTFCSTMLPRKKWPQKLKVFVKM